MLPKNLAFGVVLAYVAVLSNGTQIPTLALFPDLGSAFGTLVFDSADVLNAEARLDLVAQGLLNIDVLGTAPKGRVRS